MILKITGESVIFTITKFSLPDNYLKAFDRMPPVKGVLRMCLSQTTWARGVSRTWGADRRYRLQFCGAVL